MGSQEGMGVDGWFFADRHSQGMRVDDAAGKQQ